jgi:antitoxin YefM
MKEDATNNCAEDSDENNAMAETQYIIKTEANRKRLQEAIDEMSSGVYYQHGLIED